MKTQNKKSVISLEMSINNNRNPTIAQTNIISQISPNLNYKNAYIELNKHDELYLIAPLSLENTLKEIIKDTEIINETKNFDFSAVLAILLKIEHLNPIDNHNGFKIQEILTKTWRFVKHYNITNKLLFYDTLASLSQQINNPTLIASTLVMFYIPHIKNMDNIYHKIYQPRF